MEKKSKLICSYTAKGNNRRVWIGVWEEHTETGNSYAVEILTKRLVDRKKRQITASDVIYSIETLLAIRDLVMHLTEANPLFEKKLVNNIKGGNIYSCKIVFNVHERESFDLLTHNK